MKKNPILVKLGERLRSLRQEQGYSQEAFAAKANLARAYYGEVERGTRNIAILNLSRIAKALRCPIQDLFP